MKNFQSTRKAKDEEKKEKFRKFYKPNDKMYIFSWTLAKKKNRL